MQQGEYLIDYLNRIKEITDQLNSLESPTDEKEICYKIVATLTSQFEPLIMQLKDQDLKISYLQNRFALEESRDLSKASTTLSNQTN